MTGAATRDVWAIVAEIWAEIEDLTCRISELEKVTLPRPVPARSPEPFRRGAAALVLGGVR